MAPEEDSSGSAQWVGWTASPHLPYGRGTNDILLSCLFTLLICTWTVQHLPIPARSEKWYWTYLRKGRILVITILAPEMLIGAAVGDYFLARKSVKEMASKELPQIWTMTHGFFALMGGFQVKVVDSDGTETFFPINYKGTLALKNELGLEVSLVAEEDIKDKAKADVLVKATAVLQSLWLAIQVFSRTIQHLPITPLELATLGFVGCTIATYLVWWWKPQNAEVPITILCTRATPRIQAIINQGWHDEIQISEAWKMSVQNTFLSKGRLRTKHYFAGVHNHSMRFSMFAGMLFGSIHIIGWNFSFPTKIEIVLWRTAAVTATAMPAALFAILMSQLHINWVYKLTEILRGVHNEKNSHVERDIGWPEWIIMALYAVMRIYLLVALFITFRSQPVSVYRVVDWSKYFPHWS